MDVTFKGRVVGNYGTHADNHVKTSAVCVSPSDDVVVVCHAENIAVYKKTGEEVGKLAGHKSDITCCSIGHELLATGSSKGVILLWKYRDMKRVARIGTPASPINSLSLSVSGRYLAVSYSNRKPRIYTLQGGDGSLLTGPSYKELSGHGSGAAAVVVTDMKFSAMSDENLMTSADDGTVKFWKISDGECIGTIEVPGEGAVLQVEYLPGTFIAILTQNGGLSVFDLKTQKRTYHATGQHKLLAAGANSPLASTIDDSNLLFAYNVAQQKEHLKKGTTHEGNILAMTINPTGKNVITSGADGKALLWE